MTREEVKKILGEEATDNQITSFLNYYHTYDTKKNAEIDNYKNAISGYSDYNDIKNELDNLKKKSMTSEELLAAKQKELDNQIEQAKKEQAKYLKKENSLEAKSILMNAGVTNEDELKGILSSISSDDKNTTILNANNIANSIKSIKEATEKEIKAKLMSNEPNPNVPGGNKSNNDDTMTKAKFEKLSYEEQFNWKKEHSDEYDNLYKN